MSYNGVPQNDWNNSNYPSRLSMTLKNPRTKAAANQESKSCCNPCNIFLLTVFIVAVSLAIILPLTLSDRYYGASSITNTTPFSKNNSSAPLVENEGNPGMKTEEEPDKNKGTKEIGHEHPTLDPLSYFEPLDLTEDVPQINVTSISIENKEELKNFSIKDDPSVIASKKQSGINEDKNMSDSFSYIINEIFKKEYANGKITREDIKAWARNMISHPSIEIGILGAIAVFMGLLLLVIGCICLMQKNAAKKRILRIKDVVTDLQAPDRVILLTSDLSDEEA